MGKTIFGFILGASVTTNVFLWVTVKAATKKLKKMEDKESE